MLFSWMGAWKAAVFACVAAVVVATPAAAASGGAKTRSILVLELKGDPSVIDAATLQTITSTLSVSVSKRKGLSVLTAQDVKNLVDVEAQRQMLGCTPGSESCLAEVANAMGAELVLSGDVGKLGSSYVINLHLFDAGKARSVGRDNLVVADLSQLPQLLDASVAGLLTPITGEQGLTSKTGGVSIPTVDANALKTGGLKAINMQAETALERAMDLQDDPEARPEAKRDAWCALAQVPGNNPYFGPAQKACDEWGAYVVQSELLQQSVAADYDTLAGFLQLKRKTREQKLEAVDAFLQSYSRLDSEDVRAVQDARRRLAGGDDDVTLPTRKTATPAADAVPDGPPEPGFLDNCLDGVGCIALNFEATPHIGLVIGTHLALSTDITKPEKFDPLLPPSLVLGGRFAWAALETGLNLDIDFQGRVPGPGEDQNGNGFIDDADGNDDSGFGIPDNDGDGVFDDEDDDKDLSCADGGGVDSDFDGDTTGCSNNIVEPKAAAAFLIHGYLGLQTISVGVDGITLLRPSVGLDLYSNGFEQNDIGLYVANTFVFTDLLQVRAFLRSHIGGEVVVRQVQIGVEGSLDYLKLLDE